MEKYIQLLLSLPSEKIIAIATLTSAMAAIGATFTLFGSMIAAFMAAFVARKQRQLVAQQYEIQRRQQKLEELRLRHELYDRRMEIYRVLKGLLLHILCYANVDSDILLAFARNTADSDFLFNDEIPQYLHEVYQRAAKIHTTRFFLDNQSPPSEERQRLVNEHGEAQQWMIEQFEHNIAKGKFMPYLGLDHIEE